MIATRRGGFALALLTASASAHAQPAPRDPAAAEALFTRGKQLVEQGKTAEACGAFAESQRLDPAGGTLLRLALCHEAIGKLASAWVEFTEVERVSREGTGEAAKLQERVRIARAHLASLEPRVPKLVVSVAAPARVGGLQVTANGLPRDAGTWGVALPVDPGEVTVEATAPARAKFSATLRVFEGQKASVEVPALDPVAKAPDRLASSSAGSLWRPAGVVVGALGVVALGVGTYFGVHAIQQWNDASSACPGASCSNPQGVSAAGSARDAARAADFTLGGGVVALALGVVLYVTGAPKAVEVQGSGVAVRY